MRSVVRSNGLRNGDIPSSSSPALVMPLGEKADMLRDDLLDPTGPAAGAMECCPHPVLVTDPEGKLYRVNAALGREPGCSAEEVLAMGNAYRFPGPQKDGEGRIRRINADGRISMPSVLARRDGPTQKVMRHVVHASDGAEPRTMTVMRSGPWITGVICFILWSPSWSKMDHIVYLDKSAGALEAMRHGKKTMVGRAYNGRRSPYGKVKTGDMLYFTENDGKQIIYGRGRVTVVYDSPKLTHDESVGLLERFRRPLWLSEAQFLRMAGKRYLVLVTVDGFQEVPRFRFTRRDFHTMDDWILVGDVEKARDDDPVRDMK